MVYYGFKLNRYKAWLYPLMFLINPFLNWVYMFYSVLTFTHRTWGGPRTNVEKLKISDEEAPVVEPFSTSDTVINTSCSTSFLPLPLSPLLLQPSDKIEGCFAVPKRDENGFYAFSDMSTLNLSNPGSPSPTSSQRLNRQTTTTISSLQSSFDEYGSQTVPLSPSRIRQYMHDHSSSSSVASSEDEDNLDKDHTNDDGNNSSIGISTTANITTSKRQSYNHMFCNRSPLSSTPTTS